MPEITEETLSLEELDIMIKTLTERRETKIEALEELEKIVETPEAYVEKMPEKAQLLILMKKISIKAYQGAIKMFREKEGPRQQKEIDLLGDIVTKLYVMRINIE